ncbi:MAG: hypothetical protein J5722_03570 [Oscillospiraceae bacterium]|nr:hypothetical protein [Oscillospiraceae bacterium]
MKTQDFMNALGGIDERYLKDILEADAAAAAEQQKPVIVPGITVSGGSREQAVPVSVPHTDSGRIGSGIFRYLFLAASAAACIGGVSLLVMLGKQRPDDLFRDSEPVEVSEITAAVTAADPAAESAGSVTTDTTAARIPETTASAEKKADSGRGRHRREPNSLRRRRSLLRKRQAVPYKRPPQRSQLHAQTRL